MTVLLAKQNLTGFNRPLDANLLVVPTNGSLGLRSIDIVDLIGEHGLVAQHQESVCKAAGDEELAFVLGAKLRHDIPTERRRLATQVDSYIKHPTADDTHQLCLGELTTLIVQATLHAERRLRFIVLNELHLSYMLVKFSLFPSFKEIASGIFEHFWLYDKHAFYLCLDKLHNQCCLKSHAKLRLFFHFFEDSFVFFDKIA